MLRHDLREVEVPVAAVEEPDRELELVRPHEELGVVSAQLVEHGPPDEPCATPEGEEPGPVLLREHVVRVLRADDLEGHEVRLVFARRVHCPLEVAGQEVAVVVEDQHVVAASHSEPVVPRRRPDVCVARD